VIFKLN